MPNNCDFSELQNIQTIEVSPIGWVEKLVIEYGIGDQQGPTYFWRVRGTNHTFVIPVVRMNFISSGNYGTHFTEVLENFKEHDYESWKREKFSAPWMREYYDDFKGFIL